jgi:hypothetical protein
MSHWDFFASPRLRVKDCLFEAEPGLKGEPFKITGLLGYLLKIERKDADRHASAGEAFPG